MKLRPDMNIVCICRHGQVRSVAARYILAGYGYYRVLCCGWESTHEETLAMLYMWANAVLIVGRPSDWRLNIPADKVCMIEVGKDTYDRYDNPDLLKLVDDRIKEFLP